MNTNLTRVRISRRQLWRLLPKSSKACVEEDIGMKFKTYVALRWVIPCFMLAFFFFIYNALSSAAWFYGIAAAATFLVALIAQRKRNKANEILCYWLDTNRGVVAVLTAHNQEVLLGLSPELRAICDDHLYSLGREVERHKILKAEEPEVSMLPLRLAHGALWKRGLAYFSTPEHYLPGR